MEAVSQEYQAQEWDEVLEEFSLVALQHQVQHSCARTSVRVSDMALLLPVEEQDVSTYLSLVMTSALHTTV